MRACLIIFGWGSLGSIESQSSPFVALEANHDDEESGHDDPAQDDVHREEVACVDHVVLDDLIRSGIRGKVVASAHLAGMAEAHYVHRDEDCVGQDSRQFLRPSRECLKRGR